MMLDHIVSGIVAACVNRGNGGGIDGRVYVFLLFKTIREFKFGGRGFHSAGGGNHDVAVDDRVEKHARIFAVRENVGVVENGIANIAANATDYIEASRATIRMVPDFHVEGG